MKICHVCGVECGDEAELCPVCGAQLRSAEEIEVLPNVIENPILAVSCDDVVTAEIFRDVLTDNGIAYTSDGGEMKVHFGGALSSEDIYVDESDLERAKELYEEVVNAEPAFDEAFEDFETEI